MRRFSTVAALALWLLVAVALTSAECPNGCSGNGACMQKDMCNCYKNYQGNDCADRTCPFGYAHVDTPKGDINMDQKRDTAGWILENSQQHPAKTYEYFNPDAKSDEAHFYMECSNKGICDRATGLCTCFDGYEGSACHRTTCPSKCSSHGTCESIREIGAKAGGTLFGIEHPGGAVAYDLWDANSTYGCRCDPWFRGPDCSKRTCKVGVDPLFLAVGTARYETFVVHAGAVTITGTPWIRLRVFDYYGESYITSKINFLDDTGNVNQQTNADAVEAALKAIPNQTFRDVNCGILGSGSGDFSKYFSVRDGTITAGMSVICQFLDNPGKHRIPEVESFSIVGVTPNAFVVTTSQQGENDEWFTKQSTLKATDWAGAEGAWVALAVTASTVTVPATVPSTFLPPLSATVFAMPPSLLKIGGHVVVATGFDDTAKTITLAFPLKKTLGSDAFLFLPDAYTGATAFTVTELRAAPTSVKPGDDVFSFAADPRLTLVEVAGTAGTPPTAGTFADPGIATGDLLFFHNQFFFVQEIAGTGPFLVRVDKPFGGKSIDGAATTGTAKPFKVVLPADKTKIYNYVSECSGRGLCSSDTGICTCFKGYTNDNCNTQNILAL